MSQPLLSASAIFGAVDLKEEIVDVPEWGGSIRLVQMTAAESMQLTRDMDTKEGADAGIFLMLVYSARNENGERVFTNDDIDRLRHKNFNVLDKLQRVALRLNKKDEPAKEALKKD